MNNNIVLLLNSMKNYQKLKEESHIKSMWIWDLTWHCPYPHGDNLHWMISSDMSRVVLQLSPINRPFRSFFPWLWFRWEFKSGDYSRISTPTCRKRSRERYAPLWGSNQTFHRTCWYQKRQSCRTMTLKMCMKCGGLIKHLHVHTQLIK